MRARAAITIFAADRVVNPVSPDKNPVATTAKFLVL